ncbi:MAG: PEP-CTERM sorting domain-containing protein [Myxococcota bacterium]|nr:PEP-CTERM sorting domain-containing protein [Myxococcota bacterium]
MKTLAQSDRGLRRMWLWVCLMGLLAWGLIGSDQTAQAGSFVPGQYFLLDHPDGAISPPPYGLRMDSLGYTFSVELNGAQVVLDWTGGSTATLIGTLWNNQTSELWSVDYEITGIAAAPASLGFTATGGNGSLIDPSLSATSLLGKQDGTGSAFTLLADGHRLGGHPASGGPDTPVARGWIQGSGTNDWLAVVTPIPEPSTGLLLALGLIGLGGFRRRQ